MKKFIVVALLLTLFACTSLALSSFDETYEDETLYMPSDRNYQSFDEYAEDMAVLANTNFADFFRFTSRVQDKIAQAVPKSVGEALYGGAKKLHKGINEIKKIFRDAEDETLYMPSDRNYQSFDEYAEDMAVLANTNFLNFAKLKEAAQRAREKARETFLRLTGRAGKEGKERKDVETLANTNFLNFAKLKEAAQKAREKARETFLRLTGRAGKEGKDVETLANNNFAKFFKNIKEAGKKAHQKARETFLRLAGRAGKEGKDVETLTNKNFANFFKNIKEAGKKAHQKAKEVFHRLSGRHFQN